MLPSLASLHVLAGLASPNILAPNCLRLSYFFRTKCWPVALAHAKNALMYRPLCIMWLSGLKSSNEVNHNSSCSAAASSGSLVARVGDMKLPNKTLLLWLRMPLRLIPKFMLDSPDLQHKSDEGEMDTSASLPICQVLDGEHMYKFVLYGACFAEMSRAGPSLQAKCTADGLVNGLSAA